MFRVSAAMDVARRTRESKMYSTCGKFEIETVMIGKRTTYNIWCLTTGLVIERAWSMEMAQLKAMRAGAEF